MVSDVVGDGGLELRKALEGAAPDALGGDFGEEALDLVEPAGVGRNEVQLPMRASGQPANNFESLVGRVIIEDKMDVEPGRYGGFNLSQKGQELTAAVASLGAGDDPARGYVQRGKK